MTKIVCMGELGFSPEKHLTLTRLHDFVNHQWPGIEHKQ